MSINISSGMGAGGYCVCPKCGEEIAHRQGVPGQEEWCSNCGVKMLREGSKHQRLPDLVRRG